MRTVVATAAALIFTASAAPALADDGDRRPAHVSVGGATYLGLTGSDWGPVGVLEIYPGGSFQRFGLRGSLLGYQGIDDGEATLGVVYEGAASRPRLQLALHADVGLTWSEVRPVAGGGIEAHLWVWGPLALASDTGLVLRIDGTDSVLAIRGSLQLRLAW